LGAFRLVGRRTPFCGVDATVACDAACGNRSSLCGVEGVWRLYREDWP